MNRADRQLRHARARGVRAAAAERRSTERARSTRRVRGFLRAERLRLLAAAALAL
ncbi:hypothetical protein GB864_18065, partial [Agromyces sp. MMS17-SY077]|nr:hypothetical protein [Agromyces seonyuensis]